MREPFLNEFQRYDGIYEQATGSVYPYFIQRTVLFLSKLMHDQQGDGIVNYYQRC